MKNKIFLAIIGVIIYLIPIVTVILVSNEEIKKYQTPKMEFVDYAYGEIFQVEQKDVRENIVVNATAILDDTIAIPTNGNTIWIVDEGEEIKKSQTIGYCNGVSIKGQKNGIVKKIESNYIVLKTFENIMWETQVSEEKVRYFNESLYDRSGNKLEICSISNKVNDGKVTIRFKIENVIGKCGQKRNKMRLYTGNAFKNVLTVNKKCVVNKNGNYYVRIVDSHGVFQYEQQVDVGFESDGIICVTGLEEGEFCDGGFSEYIGSKSE